MSKMSSRYEPTERNKDRAWKWLSDNILPMQNPLYKGIDFATDEIFRKKIDSLAELLDIVEGLETENE